MYGSYVHNRCEDAYTRMHTYTYLRGGGGAGAQLGYEAVQVTGRSRHHLPGLSDLATSGGLPGESRVVGADTHTQAHTRTRMHARTHAHMQSMHAYTQVYLASSALWARNICQKCGRPPEGQEWLPAHDARSDEDVCVQMKDRIEAHESLNPHGSHKDQVGARDRSVSKMCVSCVAPVWVCAGAEVSLTARRADARMDAYTHTHTHTHITHTHSTCGARRTGRR